jgi:hypothetical protein
VHQTLFPRHAYDFDDTLDFEEYVSDATDIPREDGFLMALSDSDQRDLYEHVKFISDQVQGRVATDRPATGQLAEYLTYGGYPMASDTKRALTGGEAAAGGRWAVSEFLDDPTGYVAGKTPAQASSLVTPAWVIGVFLGLIGLVEVLRFVVDVIV